MVTDDPAAADVVRALGARTRAPTSPTAGLNPALEHGARSAAGAAVAALSSDLPALRPAELAAALRAAADGARAASSPTPTAPGRRCSPPSAPTLRPAFGPGSAAGAPGRRRGRR